jgi:hypothetical protein
MSGEEIANLLVLQDGIGSLGKWGIDFRLKFFPVISSTLTPLMKNGQSVGLTFPSHFSYHQGASTTHPFAQTYSKMEFSQSIDTFYNCCPSDHLSLQWVHSSHR